MMSLVESNGGRRLLTDGHGRRIDYLRISITDHCNLDCRYCVPMSGREKVTHRDVLAYEEIARIVRVAVAAGISKVRLTGGEPLIRKDVLDLCRMLSTIPGLTDLAVTTNGLRLAKMAPELAAAGVTRVNISLDTLSRKRFHQMTGHDGLVSVLQGIRAAEAAGLTPLSINTVVMRGVNEQDVAPLARLALHRPYRIRFIELMPTSGWAQTDHQQKFMSVEEMIPLAGLNNAMDATPDGPANGPARYFRFPRSKGQVGFIAAVSNHFCGACNRLRLTADGRLRTCLFSDAEIDIKSSLRDGADDEALTEVFQRAVAAKPLGHELTTQHRPACAGGRPMQAIGG